jgi:hypothetical protein
MTGYEMMSNNIKSEGDNDAATEFSAEPGKVGLMVMLKSDEYKVAYSVSHNCKPREMSADDYAEEVMADGETRSICGLYNQREMQRGGRYGIMILNDVDED